MKRSVVLLILPMALANGIAVTSILGAPGYNAMRRHMLAGCYVLAGKKVDADNYSDSTSRHGASSHLAMLAFIVAVACVDVGLWRAQVAHRRKENGCNKVTRAVAKASASSLKRRLIKVSLALLLGAGLGYVIVKIFRTLLL